MSFWSKIFRRNNNTDYDDNIRNLDIRIHELQNEAKTADAKLEKLKKSVAKSNNFNLTTSSAVNTTIAYKPFVPPKKKKIRTMKVLLDKRKAEEAERKQQLKQKISDSFDIINVYLVEEDAKRAEDLLFKTLSLLQQINDKRFFNTYNKLQDKINDLKESLLQKEIQRREEEARQRAEEEAQRLEQEKIKKQREEEERLERERKASEYEEQLAKEEEKRHAEIERLTALVTKKKADSERILDYLEMKGVSRFYHFTDSMNLYLIKRLGGLYSWNYCEQNGINIPNTGGDIDSRRFDKKHHLEDYVRLSFCNDHPMAYRKHTEGSSLILLYIDLEVATFEDTLFTDRNAASNEFACGGKYEDLQKVNIAATQRNFVSRDEGEIFAQHQAECMIKTFIPIKYITNIDNPKQMRFGS